MEQLAIYQGIHVVTLISVVVHQIPINYIYFVCVLIGDAGQRDMFHYNVMVILPSCLCRSNCRVPVSESSKDSQHSLVLISQQVVGRFDSEILGEGVCVLLY